MALYGRRIRKSREERNQTPSFGRRGNRSLQGIPGILDYINTNASLMKSFPGMTYGVHITVSGGLKVKTYAQWAKSNITPLLSKHRYDQTLGNKKTPQKMCKTHCPKGTIDRGNFCLTQCFLNQKGQWELKKTTIKLLVSTVLSIASGHLSHALGIT